MSNVESETIDYLEVTARVQSKKLPIPKGNRLLIDRKVDKNYTPLENGDDLLVIKAQETLTLLPAMSEDWLIKIIRSQNETIRSSPKGKILEKTLQNCEHLEKNMENPIMKNIIAKLPKKFNEMSLPKNMELEIARGSSSSNSSNQMELGDDGSKLSTLPMKSSDLEAISVMEDDSDTIVTGTITDMETDTDTDYASTSDAMPSPSSGTSSTQGDKRIKEGAAALELDTLESSEDAKEPKDAILSEQRADAKNDEIATTEMRGIPTPSEDEGKSTSYVEIQIEAVHESSEKSSKSSSRSGGKSLDSDSNRYSLAKSDDSSNGSKSLEAASSKISNEETIVSTETKRSTSLVDSTIKSLSTETTRNTSLVNSSVKSLSTETKRNTSMVDSTIKPSSTYTILPSSSDSLTASPSKLSSPSRSSSSRVKEIYHMDISEIIIERDIPK